MAFACNGCGACCRHIGRTVRLTRRLDPDSEDPLTRLLLNFPFGFTADGACKKYDPEQGCTIYATRPLICRVDEMYRKYYSLHMDYNHYIRNTKAACNVLMDIFGLDDARFEK